MRRHRPALALVAASLLGVSGCAQMALATGVVTVATGAVAMSANDGCKSSSDGPGLCPRQIGLVLVLLGLAFAIPGGYALSE